MASPSSPTPERIRSAISRHELLVGMRPADVEAAVGATGCKFVDTYDGAPAEAWGYTRHNSTGELAAVPDCHEVTFLVYFVAARVAGWASAERDRP
jgi:hypothetical protein